MWKDPEVASVALGFFVPIGSIIISALEAPEQEQSGAERAVSYSLLASGWWFEICEQYVPEKVRNAKRNVWNTTSVGATLLANSEWLLANSYTALRFL